MLLTALVDVLDWSRRVDLLTATNMIVVAVKG